VNRHEIFILVPGCVDNGGDAQIFIGIRENIGLHYNSYLMDQCFQKCIPLLMWFMVH